MTVKNIGRNGAEFSPSSMRINLNDVPGLVPAIVSFSERRCKK